MNPHQTWSAARDQDFIDKWNSGMSAADMAAHFGLAVGTVSKKRQRMGLPTRGGGSGAKARWAKEKTTPAYKAAYRAPTPYVPKQLLHPVRMAPVALLERTGCAFAVDRIDGVWLFCDCTTEAVSDYCSTHKSQMYQPSYRR